MRAAAGRCPRAASPGTSLRNLPACGEREEEFLPSPQFIAPSALSRRLRDCGACRVVRIARIRLPLGLIRRRNRIVRRRNRSSVGRCVLVAVGQLVRGSTTIGITRIGRRRCLMLLLFPLGRLALLRPWVPCALVRRAALACGQKARERKWRQNGESSHGTLPQGVKN